MRIHKIPNQQKQRWLGSLTAPALLSCVIILAVAAGCGSEPSDENGNEPAETKPAINLDEPTKKDTKPSTGSKMKLNDIIRAARTWGPAYQSWFGKTAPDFTLADIGGKQHKLSDYRGKDIMLVFWATWCRPCLIEIPHLIELRNAVSPDKLAILAISNEDPAKVKKFATDHKINYTVLLNPRRLQEPYNMVNAIPSSFFIDADGKIKFGTIGLLSLGEMKGILQADPIY